MDSNVDGVLIVIDIAVVFEIGFVVVAVDVVLLGGEWFE